MGYTPIDLDFDNDLGATSINPNEPLGPAAGVWGSIFQPLFGTLTAEDQQEVWVRFLAINGLTDPPPSDVGTQNHFLSYASDVYKYLINKIVEDKITVNLPLLQPPTTGFYATAFQNFFSGVSAPEQQQLWAQFLLDHNFSITPPPEDAVTEALFNRYAESVFGLNVNVGYDFTLLNPPTTGFYANAFSSYFSGLSSLQQKKIWVQFLVNNKFTTSLPPDDAATQKLFIDYATTVLGVIQNQNVHSPEETRKRYIMSATLDSLTKMLGSLQDTIGVESRNLIFYGNWQQEYTKMMARVPTYVGQPDSTVKAPPVVNTSTDFTQFTFGYDKISVEDIANWWANSSLTKSTQPFIMNSQATNSLNEPLFTLTYTPQNGANPGTISWSYDFAVAGISNPVTGSATIPFQAPIETFTANPAQSQRDQAQTAYVTAFEQAFVHAWNDGPISLQSALSAVNGGNLTAINAVTTATTTTAVQPRSTPDNSANSSLELVQGFGYVAPTTAYNDAGGNITPLGKLSDDNAKARGEKNAQLQQVLDNVRARRKTVQNLAQSLQSNLDQSRTTITNQSDLLNSILQTITDLVHAIYRK